MSSGIALTEKIIEVDLTLTNAGDTFGPGGENTKQITGLACDVTIEKVGIITKNNAVIDIYGLKQEDVEKITTTSYRNFDVRKNVVTVRAYERGDAPSEAFQGEIFLAYGTYESPDLGVHIEATTGIYPSLMVSSPFTFEGQIDGLEIIKKYTAEAEYSYENPVPLPKMNIRDPVLNGSPIEKIQEVGRILGIQVIINDGCVKVLPWDKPLPGTIVKIGANTGMIGYPSFSNNGITVKHKYLPQFVQGGAIDVSTIVPKAAGIWKITKITHQLQSFGAGPAWQTVLDCIYPEAGGLTNG